MLLAAIKSLTIGLATGITFFQDRCKIDCMRLADAVAETEGKAGSQVQRRGRQILLRKWKKAEEKEKEKEEETITEEKYKEEDTTLGS